MLAPFVVVVQAARFVVATQHENGAIIEGMERFVMPRAVTILISLVIILVGPGCDSDPSGGPVDIVDASGPDTDALDTVASDSVDAVEEPEREDGVEDTPGPDSQGDGCRR